MQLSNNKITFVTDVRVRYADTDKMGYVYNGTYLTYFEVGRCELMRHFGLPYSEFERQGYFLPLVEAYASYKNPAYYDDLLGVETTLDFKNINSTMRFDYRILKDVLIIAEGYTIHSFVKVGIKRPVKPPIFFIEKLNKI